MDPDDIEGKSEAEITTLALDQFIALESKGVSMDDSAIAMTAVLYEPEGE